MITSVSRTTEQEYNEVNFTRAIHWIHPTTLHLMPRFIRFTNCVITLVIIHLVYILYNLLIKWLTFKAVDLSQDLLQ